MKSTLRALVSELLIPAGKWLGLGAAVGALSGCLISQEEIFLNEVPVPRNRPPRIVESQVQPSERIIRGYGTDVCDLEFSVIVEDQDVANTLRAYWFVDDEPNQLHVPQAEVRLDPSKEGKPVRDDRASYHPRFNSTQFSRLNAPGDHVVEVVVSDTVLSGRDPQPTLIKLRDGSDFADPGYSASYAWFVKTETGGHCP
jgi:hypothetical protein